MSLGIIGCDLGVTSGLAWGIFSPALRDRSSLWNALSKGRDYGWTELIAESGDTLDSGLMVCTAVMDRLAEWNLRGLGTNDVLVVIEDFQVRRNLMGGTARDKLAPVFMAWMLSGVVTGAGWCRTVQWVSSSVSMSLATDDRMKRWSYYMGHKRKRAGWIPGKVHARDAWRLVAAGLQDAP